MKVINVQLKIRKHFFRSTIKSQDEKIPIFVNVQPSSDDSESAIPKPIDLHSHLKEYER